MQTITQLTKTALTETRALTTQAAQSKDLNPKFAEWIGLNTFGDVELEKMALASQEWASAFKSKQPARWLSLIGSSGTGKTHCAKKLWAYAKEKSDWSKCDYFPKVIFWPDFVQELRTGNAYEMRNEIKRWPVLFLDDIGAERDTTGFAAEELNTLLGVRVDKWTIITSNKDLDGLKAVDGRIASRLVRGKNICVSVNTKDFAER